MEAHTLILMLGCGRLGLLRRHVLLRSRPLLSLGLVGLTHLAELFGRDASSKDGVKVNEKGLAVVELEASHLMMNVVVLGVVGEDEV